MVFLPEDVASFDACESEAIQFAGAIQPVGFLLSVDLKWRVVRASENVSMFLGMPPVDVFGQALDRLIDADLVHDLRGCLQTAGSDGVVGRLFGRSIVAGGLAYDIAAHRAGREFVLEFEPSIADQGGSLSDLRSMISNVERQGSSQNLLSVAAGHVRTFTGFDRVMIYRFDEDGAGEVVAESIRGGLEPYMGLRYPASDIPVQARALYERSFFRIICDVDAPPVAVATAASSAAGALDMSMSSLRSVSPVHLEYLRNMGVRASMSVSILRGGRLWGLFACHHPTPRRLGYELRSLIELFGQMFSYLLEEHEREDDAVYDAFAQDVFKAMPADFSSVEAIRDRLPAFLATVGDLIPCDGVAVIAGGDVTLAGITPDRRDVLSLATALDAKEGSTLASRAAWAAPVRGSGSSECSAGFLALTVSRRPRRHLVLYRREIVEAVVWAGEPVKAVVDEAGVMRLSPRRSFAAWRETVRGRSAPWTDREMRAAEGVRKTFAEMLSQRADALDPTHATQERRQEIVIAELNHRVRNVLGLVRGLVVQSAASAQDVRALVDSLDDRIRSLASAHDILTAVSWAPSSLHALLRAEVGTYSRSEDDLVLVGPDVMLQPGTYTAMAMVVHELVTNARKHGALSATTGRVLVETTAAPTGDVLVSWKEADGPRVLPPTRRGFGSTILEQAIPFECGGTSAAAYDPAGFRLDVALPPRCAACVAVAVASVDRERRPLDVAELGGLLANVLIVEDNLFIAIDAEDMLRTLGAGAIEVVKTVAEALDAIGRRRFSFALLDVNLGAETSLPVALGLRRQRIPFVFATGYGQALGMPASLEDVEIVSKPYDRYAMGAALMNLMSGEDLLHSVDVYSDLQAIAGASVVAGPFMEVLDAGWIDPMVPTPRAPPAVPVQPEAPSTSETPAAASLGIEPAPGAIGEPLCFLRKLEALATLSSEDRAGVRRATVRSALVARRTDIVREGDSPGGLHVVLHGFACRFTLRTDGSRQITSYLVPGDYCDLSAFPGRMADALGTLSDCRVATVAQDAAMALKSDRPQIAIAMARSDYVDQAVARQWLTNVGRRTSEERFAHLFCELLFRLRMVGLADRDEFRMPLTQFDLGDTLGLSYVHVNRTLQSLRQRGLVTFKGKLLSILDLPKLKSLAAFSPGYLRFVDR